jgi:hypothetical protein
MIYEYYAWNWVCFVPQINKAWAYDNTYIWSASKLLNMSHKKKLQNRELPCVQTSNID